MATYHRLQQKFVKELCPKGTEEEFQNLYDRYRELGHYLPLMPDGSLDLQAIKNNLGNLERQRFWIVQVLDELNSKDTDFSLLRNDLKWLRDYLQTLMKDKKDYFFQPDLKAKEELIKRSTFRVKSFKQAFHNFLGKTPFLLSFDFPSPINELRLIYDDYKLKKNFAKANEIYFYRRIVEDGTSDLSGNLSDANARLTLNTVYFKLQKQESFFSEDLYFDLKYLLNFWEKVLEADKGKQIERMKRWQFRLENRYQFYQGIMHNELKLGGKKVDLGQFLKSQNANRLNLEHFVARKERDTYLFWAKQSELMQALFSLETILYNEVGAMDSEAFERKDITQIVLNRSEMPYYWILAPEDHLYKELPHEEGRLIVGNKWLNILFKSSEFSFSYFYIHANHRIYCPEFGKLDQTLRKENLRLALKQLKNPQWDFKATRYFSRVSMPGRIDMGRVWGEDFKAYPERAGKLVSSPKVLKKLKESYKKGEWNYLYQFTDDKGENFRVVEINASYWVMPLNEIRFFSYRHSDYFRYFEPKKN